MSHQDDAQRRALSSARPTPGPWKVCRRFDIYQDLGAVGGTYIGTTRGNGSLPESVALVDEANARIMAAAPVMLAALKRQHENIQRWLSTGEAAGPEESREIAEQIANAIQAATMMESPDED